MNDRNFTKSLFKIAMDCPAKLFYTKKKMEYADKSLDDEFLAALAEGGHQVGALAQCYYPEGILVDTLDKEQALNRTKELLKKDKVTIFEAAIQYRNYFIRIDILNKNGNELELIEVKAKSYNSEKDNFIKNDGCLNTTWKEYLEDVAFQKYVLQKAFTEYNISSYLMLADKTAACSVTGLNQKFKIIKDEKGHVSIKIHGAVQPENLGSEILKKVSADNAVKLIHSANYFKEYGKTTFEELIDYFQENYSRDKKIDVQVNRHCKKCSFKTTPEDEANGLKSGFKECWKKMAGFSDDDFNKPLSFDIWKLPYRRADRLINSQKYFMAELEKSDIFKKALDTIAEEGLQNNQRQWLQIEKMKNNDNTPYIDRDYLKTQINSWKFPLHFIDFETSAIAIPFHQGRKPYEQIAFQFSHHVVHKNGIIEHIGEYINHKSGVFPNFEFVRALKKELQNDNGTIFRYAAHENSILNAIYLQLYDSPEPDKDELCDWIKTITKATDTSIDLFGNWTGERNMVDLCDIIKKGYYNPATNGSNSIKAVLPAILNSSALLQDKYSKPIYGTEKFISKNFKNHLWITRDDQGNVINPYKTLPPVFENLDDELLDNLLTDEETEINQGGAALTAYGKMQFTEMSDNERNALTKALLKYCELDTFAMVLIWEYLVNQI